jgi:hypothetical protein
MKKSILLFAIIATIFTACEQQIKNLNYVNQDVYGTWSRNYSDLQKEEATSVIFINDRNVKFISEDSLRIYHGYWMFTEVSDLGYVEYKYEVIKNEKLILTSYNPFTETNITKEYLWNPDLSYIEENALSSTGKLHIKNFLGKWEWVSTQNLDSCSAKLKKHIVDTLENSIIEFKTNTFITHPLIQHKNIDVKIMFPYTAIISKKDGNIINDKVLPYFESEIYPGQVTFLFPVYNNNKFTDFYSYFGGTHYSFSPSALEKNQLILYNDDTELLLIFKRIE